VRLIPAHRQVLGLSEARASRIADRPGHDDEATVVRLEVLVSFAYVEMEERQGRPQGREAITVPFRFVVGVPSMLSGGAVAVQQARN